MRSNSVLEKTLKVVEIFHSIQGEGANTGKSAIFVRLSNCNKNCWYCDTDWTFGTNLTVNQVLEKVKSLSSSSDFSTKLIIWTGGEPTLQLTDEILEHFSDFINCIETNGSNPVPSLIQYISCSPKVSTEILRKNFKHVNEFRYPIGLGDTLPDISELPTADNYFVSPIFLGEIKKRFDMNQENINYVVNLIKNNSNWRLSLQIHKLLNIR